MKLISNNSNLCDHNSPTSQTDRQTDRQTTCDPNTALCTKVHRAVMITRYMCRFIARLPTYYLLNFMNSSGKIKLYLTVISDGVCQETSCLNHLLPDKRDPHIISKMRHPTWYPFPVTVLNVISLSYIMPSVIMKKFIRHAGCNTNITMTMSMQRQICT